jgi:hypothetical protein
MLSPQVYDWLISGPAWMRCRVAQDLEGAAPDAGGAATDADGADSPALRQQMLADPAIRGLIAGLQDWPGSPLTSHKSAGHALHQLVFLADLGMRQDDPGMAPIIARILAQAAETGPFRVLANVPRHFGGSGEDELAWALCDTPLLLYALARFGLEEHPALGKAAAFLAGLARPNGWPCAVSPELGRFRGPGRKDDPCPYANLVMLQALAQLAAYRDSPAARAGVESALEVWAARRERHPYMFFMGTDFCKLKAPLVWYDLLHVLDVLTRFPWALADPRLHEMLAALRAKTAPDGRCTPESVWTAWKDWEFAQKKEPSRWITFLAARIEQRVSG